MQKENCIPWPLKLRPRVTVATEATADLSLLYKTKHLVGILEVKQ